MSLLFCYSCVHGQLMQNGDFSINGGNISEPGCFDINSGGLPGLYIDDNPAVFPNWRITHGSPHFYYLYYNSNEILLFNSQGAGEGIVGGYPFVQGNEYIFNIGIAGGVNPASFKVYLGKGAKPYTDDCVVTCYGEYNGKRPLIPLFNSFLVPTTNIDVGDNVFTLTASDNYEWVWIYYYNPDECDEATLLTHVFISPKCKEDLYLTQSTIPNNYYTGYKRITAGSGTSSMSAINNGAHLEASQLVVLNRSFSAQATIGNPFIAEVNLLSCDNNGIYSRPAKREDLEFKIEIPLNGLNNGGSDQILASNMDVHISPNPTSDKVEIHVSDYSNITVSLTKIDGTVLQTWKARGAIETISLWKYPSGIYLIKISGPGQEIVRKIVKTSY